MSQLQPNLHLPDQEALEVLSLILDQVDEKILVLSKKGEFVYYNEKYLEYYGSMWEENGISREELPSQNLFSLKTKDAEILKEILRSQKSVDKFYNSPGVGEKHIDHNVFSDIYPIFIGGEYFGIVVIEHNTELIISLNQQLAYYKSQNKDLKKQLYDKDELPQEFQRIVGDSVQMTRTLKMCAHVAPSRSSVCLMGESGTGKEVLAEAIHAGSQNAAGPLIKVNCAAIPESLIESELFGYEKGAFTGANPNGSMGKFELANGGTLFLDEIGEMPLAMQAKLLRVIQEKEIVRIGGSKTIKLNFRLITATNRNLEKMVRDGTFREDLYYRICVIPIYIPSLRDRRDDIPLLANHFLEEYNASSQRMRVFSEAVLQRFVDYSWPGNIRELKNCVERMSILCMDDCIDVDYLPPQIAGAAFPQGPVQESQYNLHEIVEKVEYDTIRTVLSLAKGNKSKAIDILGISKRNFYLKLEKYGLK